MSLLALFVASLSSLVGLLFLKFRPNESIMHILVGVGAGIMTSISLTDILPETSETIESAGIFFFVGFCVVFLLDYFHCTHPHVGHAEHHDDHSHDSHPQSHDSHSSRHSHSKYRGLLSFGGLYVHTFFDGVAIITAFSIDAHIGILVALGVILHQIPVSLGLFSILQSSKFTLAKIQIFYAVFACSLVFGGLVASLPVLVSIEPYLLAFAGGTLLYVGASDLLPDLKNHSKFAFKSVLSFFLGGAIPVIVALVVGHAH